MKNPLAEYEDEKSIDALSKKKAFDSIQLRNEQWITAQMAKKKDTDMYLATNARETLFYVVFVICLTMVALGIADPTMYFMAQGLRAQMVDHAGKPYPEPEDTSKVKFYEISTVDDMWDYLEAHLVPLLYSTTVEQSEQRDKGIGKENVMIGVPVIRQVMVTKINCPDPFPKVFRDCYPEYSKRNMHNKDMEFKYQTAKDTQAATWSGRIAKYYADGYQEELNRSSEAANSTLQKLKKMRFVKRGTRAIFIDAAYYNPHVNLFTAVKIVFELPPTGGVIPTANFYTMKLLRYVSTKDHLVLACEIMYCAFVFFYIVEELRELFYLRKKYFCDFWNYVDLAVITSAATLIILRILHYSEAQELLETIERDSSKYNSFQSIAKSEMCLRNAMAFAIFLTYFKLFKYLSFNRAMIEIHRALDKSLYDIAAFLFVLFIVFTGFALFGCLSFGTQLWDFSTYGLGLFTLMRILLGDFSFDTLREADSIVAHIFYILFLVTVYFIILNLFLSIVYDCYGDVKMESAILPEEKQQTDFWRLSIYNLMRFCQCTACIPSGLVRQRRRTKTTEDIRMALKRCGFTDLDIEMFLNRYNVDPDARVRTRDVDKLMDNLKSELPRKEGDTGLTEEPPSMPGYAVESSKPGMQTRKEGMSTRAPTVAQNDFAAQQERLDRVESVMGSIADKLDILLKKLNTFEARKIPL